MEKRLISVITKDKEEQYGLYEIVLKMSKSVEFCTALEKSTIVNNQTGEIFYSFEQLFAEYKKTAYDVASAVFLSNDIQMKKISKTISHTVSRIRSEVFKRKIEDETITSKEYLEYMIFKYGTLEKFFEQNELSCSKFKILNVVELPNLRDVLSMEDYGRFMVLVELAHSDNRLRHVNGKPISYDILINELKFTGDGVKAQAKRDLQEYIDRLISLNLVATTKTKTRIYIVVNPLYVFTRVPVTHLTYFLFPEDCSKIIESKEMLKYFELCRIEDSNESSFCTEEDYKKVTTFA